jgi:hypothetical protein
LRIGSSWFVLGVCVASLGRLAAAATAGLLRAPQKPTTRQWPPHSLTRTENSNAGRPTDGRPPLKGPTGGYFLFFCTRPPCDHSATGASFHVCRVPIPGEVVVVQWVF